MLDRLHEFQVFATHLNYTTAASELGISQSSLGRHLVELEEYVGTVLIDKNPTRLTAAGDRFLEGIPKVIDEFSILVGETKSFSHVKKSSLSVATIDWGGYPASVIYGVFGLMKDHDPNFTYKICVDRKYTIFEMVEKGMADVGIIIHKPDEFPEDLVVEWLFDRTCVAWVHEESDIPEKIESIEELSTYALVTSISRKFSDWTERTLVGFTEQGLNPKLRIKNVDSFVDLIMSLQKDEFFLVSNDILDLHNYNKHLRQVEFTDEEAATFSVYLIYKKDSQNPTAKMFVDLCKAMVK